MKSLTESLRSYSDVLESVLQERGINSIFHDEVQRNWTTYAAKIDTTRVQAIAAKVFQCPAEQVHVEIDINNYEETAVFCNYYSKDEALKAISGYLTYTNMYHKFANFGIKGAQIRGASIDDTINPNAWVDLTDAQTPGEVLHKLPELSNGTITVVFDVDEASYFDQGM